MSILFTLLCLLTLACGLDALACELGLREVFHLLCLTHGDVWVVVIQCDEDIVGRGVVCSDRGSASGLAEVVLDDLERRRES